MGDESPEHAEPPWSEDSIEFDPAKNAANVAKHGLELTFALHVMADPMIVNFEDARHSYGEIRWRSLGAVDGRVYVVVHTMRVARRRVISVRKANAREKKIYDYAQAKP